MEKIIEIKDLYKKFKDVRAVDGLNFCVRKGEFFALLGVNGAGKSTAISIICGILEKDSGEVFIGGREIGEAKEDAGRKTGVVFQNSVLDKMLTVKENLECRAALYGIAGAEFKKRLAELSDLLALNEILHRPAGKLSGGQLRRADIARALVHEPEIVILDEPTTGLDPQTRKLLWNALYTLRKEKGITVLLTTHYMEEASDADYVVIMDEGRVAAEGSPVQLKNKYTGDYVTVYGITEKQAMSFSLPFEKVAGGFRFAVGNTAEATALIVRNPELFDDYEVTKGKMDDVFLAVTGKKLSGDDL